ncbi:MAG: nicotinamide mononucleotide transporter [Actinobacteria bacterium]|nr:nicotinamide mononucleotide transporter [Actinomycetota bacterium]MCB9411589.1 nicotinamide mononucleotide transporter [Actinomycetota bacterium]
MTVLFSAWGYDVTLLELASVLLAFLAIGLGIKGTRWTWPFYFLSGLLYGWLFIEFDLFASAAMQLIFMVAAVWGWFTWGREGVRVPGRLTGGQRLLGAAAVLVLWVALAPLLQSIGGVATWGDAFMFVGSLGAQLLMVFEKVEAWPSWIVVNVVGTVLYASQGLYFTSLFYAALIVMALVGWREWSRRRAAAEPAVAQPAPAHA